MLDNQALCTVCSDPKSKLIIKCENCLKDYCTKCISMKKPVFEALNSTNNSHWFCDFCNEPTMSLIKNDRTIKEACERYMKSFAQQLENIEDKLLTTAHSDDVAKLEQSIQLLTKELDVVKTEATELRNTLASSNEEKSAAKIGVKEIIDRDARRKNIVLFNVLESKNENPESRKNEDESFINKLFKDVLNVEIPCNKATRLGAKQESQARPLRITVETQEQHESILKNAKNLRNHKEGPYANVSIRPDLTFLERQEMRELVKEKKRKQLESNQSQDGKIWIIRNWKIVNVTRNPASQTTQAIPKPRKE